MPPLSPCLPARLAGQYTLYGYFSSIQNITSFDPVDVSKPKLPSKDFSMQVRRGRAGDG